MLVATVGAGAANASTRSAAGRSVAVRAVSAERALATPRVSTFCLDAANAAATNIASAQSSTEKSLTAAFAKLKSEEPAILSAAPSQIKGDFQTLFTYFNGFYNELAKYGYNFIKVPTSYLTSLTSQESKVEAASKAIDTYMTKSCGITPKT
jgi:hypothetical protein